MPPRRPAWRVYLLRCGDGTLYAGATNDLARRLSAHARGAGGRYTRSRLPVVLVWSRWARDRSDALRREAGLKKLSREQKLWLVATGGALRPPPRRRAAPSAARVRRSRRA